MAKIVLTTSDKEVDRIFALEIMWEMRDTYENVQFFYSENKQKLFHSIRVSFE